MYSCGITPYDSAHLGHATVYLAFDILQRRLRDLGHETRCVRNVTDVDDDILRKASELGVHFLDLAAEEIRRFDADMAALGLIPAWSEPRATSAIPDILTLIGRCSIGARLPGRRGGVLRCHRLPGLRGGEPLDEAEMLALAAEHGGNPDDPNKRDPLDFVLWQPSLPTSRRGSRGGAPGGRDGTSSARRWPSASWGRPSTCTAAGGPHLPHHECEAAQSESVTGRRSCATGCMSGWWAWTGPRCPSRSATWSSWATC